MYVEVDRPPIAGRSTYVKTVFPTSEYSTSQSSKQFRCILFRRGHRLVYFTRKGNRNKKREKSNVENVVRWEEGQGAVFGPSLYTRLH